MAEPKPDPPVVYISPKKSRETTIIADQQSGTSKCPVTGLCRIADEYCEESSLHGLKYIGDNNRHWFERLIWALWCCGGFTMVGVFIYPIYDKWRLDPTITTVDDTNYPIWNIYFPAVTICTNNKIVKTRLAAVVRERNLWEHLRDYEKKLYGTEANYVDALESVLEKFVLFDQLDGPSLLENLGPRERHFMNNYDKYIPALLEKSSHTCLNLIISCRWQGHDVRCNRIFLFQRTDAGFCCTFNGVKQRHNFAFQNQGTFKSTDDYDYEDGNSLLDKFNGTLTDDLISDETINKTGNKNNEKTEDKTGDKTKDKTGNKNDEKTDKTGEKTFDKTGDKTGNKNSDRTGDKIVTGTSKRIKRNVEDIEGPPFLVPRRANGASAQLGLQLILDPNIGDYSDSALNYNYGFKVSVHDPYDFPSVAGRGFTVDHGQEVFVGLSASLTDSTDKVKQMSFTRRKCVTQGEPMSDYTPDGIAVFRKYSRESCLLECRARYMQKLCGCLPYYYPAFGTVWNVSTSCNVKGLRCLARKSAFLHALEPRAFDDNSTYIKAPHCNCPNDCSETVYSQEISQASLFPHDLKKLVLRKSLRNQRGILKDTNPEFLRESRAFKLLDRSEDVSYTPSQRREFLRQYQEVEKNFTVAHFYFKELTVVRYLRDELYGVMDVIAAFGGIVGLCTGFSLLSALEFLYFFTIRFWFEDKKRRRVKANT